MKKLAMVVLLAAASFVPGCGGPPQNAAMKEDLDPLNRRLDELDRKIDKSITAIEQKLPGVKQDYLDMMELNKKLEGRLNDLKNIEAKAALANSNLIKVLEAEVKLLEDRLATLRATLDELKKP